MSDEQFRFIGARFEDLDAKMKVLAEANVMTREYLSGEIKSLRTETNQRIDGLEAALGRFAVRVGERFDKLEDRFDGLETKVGSLETFAGETQQRLGRLEAQGEETQQRLGRVEAQGEETQQRLGRLEVQGEETQQRLKRIEAHLPVKSSSGSRTPRRATRKR